MIKATELRLLNYVLRDGHVAEVRAIIGEDNFALIDKERGIGTHRNDGHLEPIPLTEEWLERLGLVGGHISHSYHTKVRVEKYTTATQGWLNNAWRVVLMDSIPHHLGRQFKYVHEIQNLLFAVTGEELTIKS